MTAANVPNNQITKIASAGNRKYIHIYNNTPATVYLCYDGDATAAAGLTAANGAPLLAGGSVQLNNDGTKQLFIDDVYAFQASGAAIVLNLQGV